MVVSNIKKYLEKDYRELVTSKLDLFLNSNQNSYFERRKEFINKFECNSSERVAKIIIEDYKGGINYENTK